MRRTNFYKKGEQEVDEDGKPKPHLYIEDNLWGGFTIGVENASAILAWRLRKHLDANPELKQRFLEYIEKKRSSDTQKGA